MPPIPTVDTVLVSFSESCLPISNHVWPAQRPHGPLQRIVRQSVAILDLFQRSLKFDQLNRTRIFKSHTNAQLRQIDWSIGVMTLRRPILLGTRFSEID